MVAVTLWTGYSRIADYKHHLSDVVVGFIVAFCIALIVCFLPITLIQGYDKSGNFRDYENPYCNPALISNFSAHIVLVSTLMG